MKKPYYIIMTRTSTWVILNYLNDHDHTEYNDLLMYATPFSLNRILRELLDYDLIRYYCRVETGLNCLVLTERGEKLVEAMNELKEVLLKFEGR